MKYSLTENFENENEFCVLERVEATEEHPTLDRLVAIISKEEFEKIINNNRTENGIKVMK